MIATSKPSKESLLKIRRPSPDEIRDIGNGKFMHLTEHEIQGIAIICNDLLTPIDQIDSIQEPTEQATYLERDPGRRPSPAENKFNSFITVCHVKGANKGPLLGKRVGLKDNIAVRGVPMTNASRLGEFYLPNIDATVVSKLLDAGATIVGKLNMDDFSFFGTSETSYFGPVRNPVNPKRSPGGSSSGSGTAVAANEVDLALGVDQGGSARTPAACCGLVAIKPTHGLVSTYGITYMDYSLDHICPIGRTVEDVALALQVIAGQDFRDPEWPSNEYHAEAYYDILKKSNLDITGLKVGIIEEGLPKGKIDPEIEDSFNLAIGKLPELGATCSSISIREIDWAPAIWMSMLVHSTDAIFDSCGEGYWHRGTYNPSWNEFLGRAKRSKADHLPPLLKSTLILGEYMRKEYFSVYYSKAQNLRNVLQDKIKRAFEKFDILACPTNIVKPPILKDAIEFEETRERGLMLSYNTHSFNLTGHPAITVPCGMRGGLPVGLQLIAKHWRESLLFKVARSFEKNFDWRTL
jgi:amidase